MRLTVNNRISHSCPSCCHRNVLSGIEFYQNSRANRDSVPIGIYIDSVALCKWNVEPKVIRA